MFHGGDIYSDKIEYDFSVNLNPAKCPKRVLKAVKGSLHNIDKYPDLKARSFRNEVAKLEGVSPSMVLPGNGASEMIMAAVRYIKPQRIILPVPSFYGYIHAIEALDDYEIVKYYLNKDNNFRLTADFLDFLSKENADLLILTNPNNPTGQAVDPKTLQKILKLTEKKKMAFIVDECFLKMSTSGESLKKYVDSYVNLYIVDAFTKMFSIPGIRAGYLLSAEKNIEGMKRFIPEWNISTVATEASLACVKELRKPAGFQRKTGRIISKEREYLISNLEGLFDEVYLSDTSFVLVKSDKPMYEMLLKEKMLIRDCSSFEGLGKGFYRIAVKDRKSNDKLLKSIRKVLANGN